MSSAAPNTDYTYQQTATFIIIINSSSSIGYHLYAEWLQLYA
jgi:hypothetical protein